MVDVTADIVHLELQGQLSALTILEHNNTSGLQGGSILERYHNTLAEITGLQDILAGSLTGIDSILFDMLAAVAVEPGEMAWDAEAGTLALGMPGGEAVLSMGQEQYINMRNDTGGDVGQPVPVFISGAIGNQPTFELASSLNAFPDDGSIGLTTENIADNEIGKVTTFGRIKNVKTSDWIKNDRLFVGTTPGTLINTVPSGNERKIFMGKVLVSHPTQGVIFCLPINILFPSELSGDPPIITGSRGGNVGLTSLLSGLDSIGFVDDQTTA